MAISIVAKSSEELQFETLDHKYRKDKARFLIICKDVVIFKTKITTTNQTFT